MQTVSIIVPVYNAEQWLAHCVLSIRKQSYKDLDIILVNDGSTDSSGILCAALEKSDKRIRYVRMENEGASAARNVGITMARGAFIMFCDADDYLERDAVASMISDSGGMDWVVGSFRKVGAMTTTVSHITTVMSLSHITGYVMSNLLNPRENQMLSGCWAKLYRTDIIRKHKLRFPVTQRTAEDMTFNYQYLLFCELVKFTGDVVYNNRKHGVYDSLSTRFNPSDRYGLFGFVVGLHHLRVYMSRSNYESDVLDRAIQQSYIYHMILYFVRICGQAFSWGVYGLIRDTMRSIQFRNAIRYYNPPAGAYRLIPFLMHVGFTLPVMLACRWKAKRFYR